MFLKSLTFHYKSLFFFNISYDAKLPFLIANNNALWMRVSLQNNWNDRKVFKKFKLLVLDLEVIVSRLTHERASLFVGATNTCRGHTSSKVLILFQALSSWHREAPVCTGSWYSYPRRYSNCLLLKGFPTTLYLLSLGLPYFTFCYMCCILFYFRVWNE